jgi:hypothetical protein
MKRLDWKLARIGGAILLMASTLAATSAHAGPVAVMVNEGAMSPGTLTSYFSLPILQSVSDVEGRRQDYNVYVGSFTIGIEDLQTQKWTNELAFCVDPWNWSTTGSLKYFEQNLDQVSATANATFDITMLVNHETQIDSLYSRYYKGTQGSAYNSAVFQLALWEIVSGGAVHSTQGTNTTIWNDSLKVLDDLNKPAVQPGDNYQLTAYYVNRAAAGTLGQNYLVATASTPSSDSLTNSVPEPSSMLLLGCGLLGLGFSRRRQQTRQQGQG